MFKKIKSQGVICYRAIGKYLIIPCRKAIPEQPESFFAHPCSNLKRVVRESFILSSCRDKRVLHFGFLDSPITRERITNRTLLHTKISTVASYLFGIDVNDENLSDYRNLTGDTENCIINILQPVNDVLFLAEKFDLILFPEVLEHLSNPGVALLKLREIMIHNPGSSLLITVPNAFSLPHFVSACNSVEMVHPDHYYYFSPVTLSKLLFDSGFDQIEILLYSHDQKDLGTPGITEHGIVALCKDKIYK